MTEDDLYPAARAGDAEALSSLYKLLRRHANVLFYRATGETTSPPAIEFEAEVAGKIILNMGKFDGRSKFSTWTHRIILNALTSWKRSRIRLRKREAQFPQDIDSEVSLELEIPSFHDMEFSLMFEQLLDSLATVDKEIIMGRFHGKSFAELGEELGMKEASVRQRLFKLRRRVRNGDLSACV